MGRRNRNGETKYFVSRQSYWGVDVEAHQEDGKYESDHSHYAVEIAVGGSDMANPDMLCEKWPQLGEGQEYDDPREAVTAAINIRNEWRKSPPKVDEDGSPARIEVAFGCTGGNTIPFEASETDEQLHARAEKAWESLPKCVCCGAVLGKEKYGDPHIGEYDCCSERCAESYYGDPEGRDEDDEYPVEQPEKF